MKRILTTIVLTTLAVVTAFAQVGKDTDYTPYGFRLKLGLSFPIESALRDYSKTFVGFGADYDLAIAAAKGNQLYLSGEVISKRFGVDRPNVIPITLNVRFKSKVHTIHSEGEPYAFFGAGFFFYNLNSSKMQLGLRGGVGTLIEERYFVEATGYVTTKETSSNSNGIMLTIWAGMKF